MAETATQQTFTFELVSPERKLLSGPARMVTLPGTEGDFGVLPGHAPLIATVRAGVVEVMANDNDENPHRIFVAGGFADVTATNVTVLAEEAVNVADLNRDDLEQTIRNLNEDMTLAKDDMDKRRIERRLVLVKAKLAAVTGQIVA